MISILGMIAAWTALAIAPVLEVQQGKKACHEVQLPVCWHTTGDNACFEPQQEFGASADTLPQPPPFTTWSDFYQYRMAIEDPDVLLLSAVSRKYIDRHSKFAAPVPGAGSVEQWAIRLHPNFEIRPATESEHRASLPRRVVAETRGGVPYVNLTAGLRVAWMDGQKRILLASGPLLINDAPLRISTDGRHVAILTYREPPPLCEGICLALDPLSWIAAAFMNKDYRYWIDVFEAATAERVISLREKTYFLRGVEGLRWTDPQYFIYPLNPTLDRFELCDADAEKK